MERICSVLPLTPSKGGYHAGTAYSAACPPLEGVRGRTLEKQSTSPKQVYLPNFKYKPFI